MPSSINLSIFGVNEVFVGPKNLSARKASIKMNSNKHTLRLLFK